MTVEEKKERSKARSKIKDLKLSVLLEVTKAINLNQSADSLLALFESILKGPLSIGKLIMYVKSPLKKWEKSLQFGVEQSGLNDIDVEEHLTAIKEINLVEIKDDNNIDSFDIVIPVLHKETALAYILLGDLDEQEVRISPIIKHLPFIQTLANIILVAIENKRLAKENLNQEILNKELEMATEMQNMLFPNKMPNNQHYEAAIFYKPLSNVGGDIYDYIKINEEESIFCLADVSGKGMAAALLMANFLANLRALVSVNNGLEEVAHLLNKKVVENAGGERFVTMFLAKYNNNTRTLSYINAAHNPPLLLNNQKIHHLTKGCVGMGMLDSIPTIESEHIVLTADSIMLAYTDGIVDIENEKREEYDLDKLPILLKQHQHASAHSLNEAIVDSIISHKGNMPYVDDIALLSTRFF